MSVTILVYFDDPFYAILVERRENGSLSVARQVVGPEPSEIEVLEWVQKEFPICATRPPWRTHRAAPWQ